MSSFLELLCQTVEVTKVVVVTGLSGAGRTVAAEVFEDHGWFTIDNLPAALVARVGSLVAAGNEYEQICLVIGGYDEEMSDQLEELRKKVKNFTLVYLEADTEVLVRRFKTTKRRHPLGMSQSLNEAIELERKELSPARSSADLIVDTSQLNPYELKTRIKDQVLSNDASVMRLTLVSFGFKNGLPQDADLMFDCRFMPNPYWDPDLREKTGLDEDVQEYVLRPEVSKTFLKQVHEMMINLLPAYQLEGKSYLNVAFGCTGGKHRSVTVVERLMKKLQADWSPRIHHRDRPNNA